MANNIVLLDDFDIKIADYVSEVTGLAQDMVLISYSPKGQKFGAFEDNFCFVKFYNENDEREIFKNRVQEFSDDKFTITQYAMRTLYLHIVFYGDKAGYYATLVNQSFYTQRGKEFLKKNDLAIIPNKTSFTGRSYEEINGRWWHRDDLKVFFYNTISIEETTDYISDADITIYRE